MFGNHGIENIIFVNNNWTVIINDALQQPPGSTADPYEKILKKLSSNRTAVEVFYVRGHIPILTNGSNYRTFCWAKLNYKPEFLIISIS